jgi:hypothetical protein
MLETYYEKYLKDNPNSKITFEQWKELLLKELIKEQEYKSIRLNPHESVYGC